MWSVSSWCGLLNYTMMHGQQNIKLYDDAGQQNIKLYHDSVQQNINYTMMHGQLNIKLYHDARSLKH
jgi:hypothetical protein